MTRDELERFLEQVGASTLGEYLGEPGPDEAMTVLEERIGWAVVHRNDTTHGEVAEFLARNAAGLKAVLDEGEDAWWERTQTSNRVRKPARGDDSAWKDMATFATPSTAPERADADHGSVTLDAPIESLITARKTLRKGRGITERPRGGGETLLPEAVDTPGAPVRDEGPPDATWVDDDGGPVDPDRTDPIGFAMVSLTNAERYGDSRLASTPAPAEAREAVTAYMRRQIDEDEPTDPFAGRAPPPPPPPPVAPPAPPSVDRQGTWTSFVVVALGSLTLLAGVVALLVVVADIGRRRGETYAHDAWDEAHVTSTTSVEGAPVAPDAPVPTIGAAPVPPQRRTPTAPAPVATAAPESTAPVDTPQPPATLARTTWLGTGGAGSLTLHLDAHADGAVRGRLLRTQGGLVQTIPVTGTLDAATGALSLEGEGVSMVGTLTGKSARGTWSPDGVTRQWVLARQ